MQKEGESGRRKITQYSRIGAVFLAVVPGRSASPSRCRARCAGGMPVVYNPGLGFVLTAVVALTAGTMFLMWLGEQITERGIGNGVSLIIFAGIVAGLPGAVLNTLEQARNGDISAIAVIVDPALIVLAFTFFVVFVERGQRRITVNYARRQGGRQRVHEPDLVPAAQAQHGGRDPADLRVQHLIMFPATLSTWFGQSGVRPRWLQTRRARRWRRASRCT